MSLTPHTSLEQEIAIERLDVQGIMPSWLSGLLIRNGPAKFEVAGKPLHWFDGLAMLHCFSFQEGVVSYKNRFLRSDFYKSVHRDKLPYRTFASDPCRTLFKSFFSLYYSLCDLHLVAQNANVNITKIADHFVAMTEVPLSIEFDPHTLETLGVFNYQDDLEKGMRFETAHPHIEEKGHVNYYTKLSASCSYNIYSIPKGSQRRELIAHHAVKRPSYMHSFSMTPSYIVLSEYPLVLNPLKLFLQRKPFIYNYAWKPLLGTQFLVFERESGKLICRAKTPPFFAFHHVNAFEKNEGVTLDIITYKDPAIVYDTILPYDMHESRLTRFEVKLATGTIRSKTLIDQVIELPRINTKLDGSPYTYVYGIAKEGGLIKMDTCNQSFLAWHEEGCFAGEPIFIQNPQQEGEDQGVVLSVVLDMRRGHSFLLVLNAQSFTEICRATIPLAIPLGLHGQFYAP